MVSLRLSDRLSVTHRKSGVTLCAEAHLLSHIKNFKTLRGLLPTGFSLLEPRASSLRISVASQWYSGHAALGWVWWYTQGCTGGHTVGRHIPTRVPGRHTTRVYTHPGIPTMLASLCTPWYIHHASLPMYTLVYTPLCTREACWVCIYPPCVPGRHAVCVYTLS